VRSAGDILLVSSYELGHQPHGLASPLGFLERAGFLPRACDLAVEKLDEGAVRKARFVGISVPMHTALRLGARVVSRIRALAPTAHLCFFGLYAPLNEPFLRGLGADSILGGEYEAELVALCERLEAGETPRPSSTVLARIAFAPPARAQLPPLSRYAKVVRSDGSEGLAGYTEASRGCLHLCRHCPIPPLYQGRFFIVPREIVLPDIRAQVAMGATHITFGDPDFLNGPTHALAIARALHAEFPSLTFDFTAKIEHLLAHRATLPELAGAGCLFIVSAVESIDDRLLSRLQKGHTRADVREALAVTRAAGIALRPSLVPFTPWTSIDDYLALLAFVDQEDLVGALDPVQLSIRLLVPPGSLLEDEIGGPLVESSLTRAWTHPDPRMDQLQRAVYSAVERAATDGEDRATTFSTVVRLAHEAAGHSGPPSVTRARDKKKVPGLTEAWFC
jgi:radical SAM superfamily enzyme YgiQ (UPF0313 family)